MMSILPRCFVASFLVATVATVASAQTAIQKDAVLKPELRRATERALASADPRASTDTLWSACCAEHGSAKPLLDFLANEDEKSPDQVRARRRLRARIARRSGFLSRAIGVLERMDAKTRSVRDRLELAECYDALGRDDKALKIYDALVDGELDSASRKKIVLRRALMGKGTKELARFARDANTSKEMRNAAAVVLALRGVHVTAFETFVAEGEGSLRFRQEIRRAEWAIESKRFDDAQKAAWIAVDNAKTRRDRRYALTVLASSYRRDAAIDELLALLEARDALSPELRELWIRLLREKGRADDALRLFRGADKADFDVSARRQLLEICRETGREAELVRAYRELIRDEPGEFEWRSGLSRYYLEQGERDKALAVWEDVTAKSANAKQSMRAAHALDAIGLEKVALRLAENAQQDPAMRASAAMFRFQVLLDAGAHESASVILEELDTDASATALRAACAAGYERLGQDERAADSLLRLRKKLGGSLGSDLEMKLAILLSRVNREAEALAIWRGLWSKLRSTPRGRFVEDRMMTLAARTGKLARIAIELEDRLTAGRMDAEDVELLVRLYVKVGDPASASEIVEEFMSQRGAASVGVLQRKARIYRSCQDYHHYGEVMEKLVEIDEKGRLDHLRELAMSHLERGRRDLTVELLPKIRAATPSDDTMADEFEAGVYGLCGLEGKALTSYVKGIGRNPGRIDSYLLIANLMRQTGEEARAARMFQYIAQTADKDDLFTIAIDGLLNLRAQRGSRVQDSVVRWALRVTLERLAEKPEKFYLYRLVTDLAAELKDMKLAIRTLKSALPAAGERRTPVMREILAKARSLDPGSRQSFGAPGPFKPSKNWDATDYVMVGRRLLGQGEHVPPQAFMDLATVFLREDDVEAAVRTFNRAAESLEYSEVLREAAVVLETAGRSEQALQYYKRLLAIGVDDLRLLQKVALLEEELGNDERAFEMNAMGVQRVLARKQRASGTKKVEEKVGAMRVYFGGNLSAEDEMMPLFVDGLLIGGASEAAKALLAKLEASVRAEIEARGPNGKDESTAYPRLSATLEHTRRLMLAFGMGTEVDALDAELMRAFPKDRELAATVVASRMTRGYERSARALLAGSAFANDAPLRASVGLFDDKDAAIEAQQALSRVMRELGRDKAAVADALDRVEVGSTGVERTQGILATLIAACRVAGADAPVERLARVALRPQKQANGVRVYGTEQHVIGLAAGASPKSARGLLRATLRNTAQNDPVRITSLLFALPDIEASLGIKALTSDFVTEVLRDLAKNVDKARPYFYGAELLGSVDVASRMSLVREIFELLPATHRSYFLLQAVNYLGESELDEAELDW